MRGAMSVNRIYPVALAIAVASAGAVAKSPRPAVLRPIIAQIVAEPEKYVDRQIEIYGLVVEADTAAHTFMLQDVSQRPLLIDGKKLVPVVTGDQVELAGILRMNGKDLELVASGLKRVKVIAGGGCC
jgi:hypothetical protein